MTAPAESIAPVSKGRTRFWRAPMLQSLPLRISVIVICLLWTLPTAGLFVRVVMPMIRGTIVTVTTTVAIVTLKIFDIVMSVSGGLNHDDVVAVRMFKEMFQYFNDGRAAALATVLFIAVLPVMILNLRNFRRQAAMR